MIKFRILIIALFLCAPALILTQTLPRPVRYEDHYFSVPGPGGTLKIFSSAGKDFIAANNSGWLAFLASGNQPVALASEADLWRLLALRCEDCLPDIPAARAAKRDYLVSLIDSDQKTKFLFVILFDQENRIRVLEGKQPLTRAQFLTNVRGLL